MNEAWIVRQEGDLRAATIRWRRLDGTLGQRELKWSPGGQRLPMRYTHAEFFGTEEPVDVICRERAVIRKGRHERLSLPHLMEARFPDGYVERRETVVLVIGP